MRSLTIGLVMHLKNLTNYGPYLALGTQIAASMIIPVVIGIYVDKHWNISPWGVIIGALLGFGGLISIVIKLAYGSGKNEFMNKQKHSGNGKV